MKNLIIKLAFIVSLFLSGALFISSAALFNSGAALAQITPNLFDPAAREQNPDLRNFRHSVFNKCADYPPFNYRAGSGELVGFNIDLANAICENLNLGCTMQIWPWEQAADALEDFQGDALIAGLAIDFESGARFDFSQIYMMLPGRFVAQNSGADEFNTNGLTGKTIGVRKGSAHYEFIRR
ncbi:hypothetical protein MNBD_ALPHA11-1845, partial [hydrothermal vent metagenome]